MDRFFGIGSQAVEAESDAEPANRLALLIGNAAYRQQPLLNQINDVKLLESVLKKLDFATQVVADAPSEARLHPNLWGHVRFGGLAPREFRSGIRRELHEDQDCACCEQADHNKGWRKIGGRHRCRMLQPQRRLDYQRADGDTEHEKRHPVRYQRKTQCDTSAKPCSAGEWNFWNIIQ